MGLSSPTMLWGWRIQPGIPTKTRKTQIAPGSGTNHDVKRQISSWPITLTLHNHHHVSLSICYHLNHNLCWSNYHLHKVNPVFCMRFYEPKIILTADTTICFGMFWLKSWFWLVTPSFFLLEPPCFLLKPPFSSGFHPPKSTPTIFQPGNVMPRYKNLHVQISWAK